MSGFWKFVNNDGSKIANILRKENPTLEELLDENETVSQLLASNTKLIRYFRNPEILSRLIDYVLGIQPDITTPLPHSNTETINSKQLPDTPDSLEDTSLPDRSNDELKDESNAEEQNDPEGDKGDNPDWGFKDGISDDVSDGDDDDEIESETPEEKCTRRARISAEILSSDVWSLTDALMDDVKDITRLWGSLDSTEPLSIDSANYFMKINEHLLDMKTPEMIDFVLQLPNLVDKFMKHISTSPLMDFLLKLIATDKPESPTGIIQRLKEQKLIPSLISCLSPDNSNDVQSSSTDFLKALIMMSANNADESEIGPNELTRELVSEPVMKSLTSTMLQGKSALVNGVGIVIEIIRKNNSDYDPLIPPFISPDTDLPSSRDPIYLGHMMNEFIEIMPKLTARLRKNSNITMETTIGPIIPLGFERFKICELIAELIHCSNMALINDFQAGEIIRKRDIIRQRLIQKREDSPDGGDTDIDLTKEFSDLDLDTVKESKPAVDNNNEEELRKSPVIGDMLKISLHDNDTIQSIIDIFPKFPWNNFMHNVVFDIVQQILEGSLDIGYNRYLVIDLFDKCDIISMLLQAYMKSSESMSKRNIRLGYTGHLILIAEEVAKFTSMNLDRTITSSAISKAVSRPEWKQFVSEVLADTRSKYNAVLGNDNISEESDVDSSNDDLLDSDEISMDDNRFGLKDDITEDELIRASVNMREVDDDYMDVRDQKVPPETFPDFSEARKSFREVKHSRNDSYSDLKSGTENSNNKNDVVEPDDTIHYNYRYDAQNTAVRPHMVSVSSDSESGSI